MVYGKIRRREKYKTRDRDFDLPRNHTPEMTLTLEDLQSENDKTKKTICKLNEELDTDRNRKEEENRILELGEVIE